MISDPNDKNSNSTKQGALEKPKKDKKWLIDQVVSLGTALIIVFSIRSSVIEAFKIPSGSMIPTLLVGDHIFVNKFAYGFKIPFSDLFGGEPTVIVPRDPPKRGDIVVFKYPRDESLYYIKRLIGRPGDQIEIKNKEVFVNNEQFSRTPVSAEQIKAILASLEDSSYNQDQLELFREKIGDHNPIIMTDKSNYLTESFGPIEVPVDHYFVMGDNRDFSNDSRFWGFVPMKNIKGKALFIWLSVWVDFAKSEYYFRPTRIGTVLD